MDCAGSAKILIVRTDRMGDVVLTAPVFKALRKFYPSAHIAVLVQPSAVDLVQGNPYINEVIVDDHEGLHKGVMGALHVARQIRRCHFDQAFIFHTKRRANMLCFLAGVPCRRGYKNNKFGMLLTHPLKDTRHLGLKHESQYCLDVLAAAGIPEAGLDLLVPNNKEAEVWAVQWLKDNGLAPGEIIAIHPGASDTTKQWPPQCFAQLISALTNRYMLKIVLIGGPQTVEAAGKIQAQSPTALNLAGQTSVGQMAALLRRCRLLVSNDSGPMHVGAAVGTSVIGLFLRNQPGINPERWRPLGPKSFILTNKPGEHIALDKKGQVEAGRPDSISVEKVLELAGRILEQDNQSLFYW